MKPGHEDTVAAGADPARTATLPGTSPGGAAGTADALALGQQLGHFRIERRLGAGGMGEVYLATDLALDRSVAIKVLPGELARRPDRRDRLIREARAQAQITHANVAHIYFIGEEAGRLYFAMEYIPGETLADRLTRGPLPADEALEVIRAAALGLREAQRHGITHRDVKPSNLMLDGHGVVKVLDFGLAATAPGARAGGDDAPVVQSSLAGTPLYMAPEQARGEALDLRADIYALGATLYQLVAGQPPFVADTIGELASMHATAARPAVPRRGHARTQIGALDGLCQRMMAPRPEDRFASYDELLRAIELASSSHTRPAGFAARTIAALLDLIVVGITVGLVREGAAALGAGTGADLPVVLLVLGAYHALAIARWGRTLGHAVFELEVVDVDTSAPPPLPRAIRRALVMLGPTTLIAWAAWAAHLAGVGVASDVLEGITIATLPLALAALLYATLRRPGKRAVWDRSACTLVRYRPTRTTLRAAA